MKRNLKALTQQSENMTLFSMMLVISLFMVSSIGYAQPGSESKDDFLHSIDSVRIKLKDLIIASERESRTQLKGDSRVMILSSEISADMELLDKRSSIIVHTEMVSATKEWLSLNKGINTFLQYRFNISDVFFEAQGIHQQIPLLVNASDELVALMLEHNSSAAMVYVATRQLMIAQRIELYLRNATSGDSDIAAALDRFGRDVSLFKLVTDAMLEGNTKLRIKKIDEPVIREKLNKIRALFLRIDDGAGSILQNSPGFFQALDARDLILVKSDILDLKLIKLRKSFITKRTSKVDTVRPLSTRPKFDASVLAKALEKKDVKKSASILKEISDNPEYVDSANMFVMANTFLKLKDLETASFLFFAAQIRAGADLKLYMPVGKGGSSPGVALSAIKYQLGSVINPSIVKYPQAYANVVKRLDDWLPVYDEGYEPGWEYEIKPVIESAQEKIKFIKDKYLESMRDTSSLLNNEAYFEAFLIFQEQNKALPEDVNEAEKNSASEIMKNIEDELGIDGFIARLNLKGGKATSDSQ